MTWKPTEEMLEAAWEAFDYSSAAIRPAPMDAALIAVQPLIAAEERERYKNECAKFGYSCAHVSALLEDKRVVWTPAVAVLVERAQSEARAAALEEAAGVVQKWATSSDTIRLAMGEMTAQELRSVKAALRSRGDAIRSLKSPPEGT